MTPSAQKKPSKQQFLMRIEDVSVIRGRGTVVTGPIEQGTVTVGDAVEIVGAGTKPITSVVTGVIVSHKIIERGHVGNTVGVLLRGVDSSKVTPGQVLRAT